jgi:hypothetical protein
MHLLPQFQEFVEVLSGKIQDAPHRASFRIAGPDGIQALGQSYGVVGANPQ